MPKLLAPVGSLDKGVSLFRTFPEGIDAIYFSPKRRDNPEISWGRRRAWRAMTFEEIKEILPTAKQNGVREFHLAVNNHITDKDFPSFLSELEKYVDLGITHAILCEPGTVRAVHTEFPDLKIDLSIMAYVMSSRDAEFFRDMGVSSIALPPLSPLEIGRIKKTGINVELFVVGYHNPERRDCCYVSRFMGGPSFNLDGTCMRACRFDWSGVTAGQHYEHLKRDAGSYCLLETLNDYLNVLGPEDYLKIQGREWSDEIVNQLISVTRRIISGEAVSAKEIQEVDSARNCAMRSLTKEIHANQLEIKTQPHYYDFHIDTTKRPELTVSIGELDTLQRTDISVFDRIYFGRMEQCSKRVMASTDEFKDAIKYVHEQGKKIYLILPATLRDEDFLRLANLEDILATADGVEVQNYGSIKFLQQIRYNGEIVGGAWLNVYNSETVKELNDRGIEHVLLPYEASSQVLGSLAATLEIEVPVHGHLPLTIANRCLKEQEDLAIGCDNCINPLDTEFEGKWIRHYGKTTLSGIMLCLYECMNSLQSSGIRLFRIEGQSIEPAKLAEIGEIYRAKMQGQKLDNLPRLRELSPYGLCDGFFFGVDGFKYIGEVLRND